MEQDGQDLSYIASGCIRTDGGSFPERLGTIFTGVDQLLEEYRPDLMAVEQVFDQLEPRILFRRHRCITLILVQRCVLLVPIILSPSKGNASLMLAYDIWLKNRDKR